MNSFPSLRPILSRGLLGALLLAIPARAAIPGSPIATSEETPASDPAQLRTDRKQLSEELAAAWKEAEQLKATLTSQLAEANQRVAIAEAALASKDREIAALKAAPASDDNARQLASAKSEIDTLNARLAASLTHAQDLGSELGAAKKDAYVAREELAALRLAQTAAAPVATPSAPAPALSDLENANARLAEATRIQTETETKLTAALRTYTLQQGEIDRLQKALAHLDGERSDLAARLEVALAELVPLRLQAEAAATATAQANTLRTQLAELTRATEDRSATVARAEREAALLRTSSEAATGELVATREQLRQIQAQSASLARENAQLRTNLALAGTAPASALAAPTRPGAAAAPSVRLPLAGGATPPAAASATGPVAVTLPLPAAAPAAAEVRFHTVAAGDSLSRIAKRYYGNSNRWNTILEANRDIISNPNALPLGARLRIP